MFFALLETYRHYNTIVRPAVRSFSDGFLSHEACKTHGIAGFVQISVDETAPSWCTMPPSVAADF